MIKLTLSGHQDLANGSSLEAMAHEMEQALQLVERKTTGYGDAWRQQGWMGNLARILSKSSRLKQMLWQGFDIDDTDEAVDDTVLDMINLCVFFRLNRGQNNRWGR